MTVSLNPQSLASRQGREFADECIKLATRVGFELRDQRVVFPECGIEVDLVLENRAGVAFFAECKGSFRDRPGLQRTDTLKKAIANMLLLDAVGIGPLLVLTSHRPVDGVGVAMLRVAQQAVPFEVLVPRDDYRRLARLAVATEANLAGEGWNFRRRLV